MVAAEEVVAQVDGMEVADAGAMAEAKVPIQEVGQCWEGTMGTPQEAQGVREAGGY